MGWLVEKRAVLGPDGAGETLEMLLEFNGYWWRIRAQHRGRSSDSEEFRSWPHARDAYENRIIQAFVKGWKLDDVKDRQGGSP